MHSCFCGGDSDKSNEEGDDIDRLHFLVFAQMMFAMYRYYCTGNVIRIMSYVERSQICDG